MSDLTSLSNSSFLKNISEENKITNNIREKIRIYFLEKYNSEISISSFQNHYLSIRVTEAGLAAEINYNKQTDITNINNLIKPDKITKLTIKIG